MGKYPQSREFLKAFYKVQSKITRKSLLGIALFVEGLLLRFRGRGAESLGYFLQAGNILKKYGIKRPYLRVMLEMGGVYADEGNHEKLQSHLRKIKKDITTYSAEDIYARWGYLEAYLEFLKGNFESALEILNAQIMVSKDMELMEIIWQQEFLLARIYEANQQMEEAKLNYLASMETLKSIWDPLEKDLKKEYLKDPRRKQVFEESSKFLSS
ncbi:MAG: hypothetical protein D6785_14720 [Planctomycetota bacterium]|nr:MAG: hypothetical protein D6785_14720 [Planctomycetota bacterium]